MSLVFEIEGVSNNLQAEATLGRVVVALLKQGKRVPSIDFENTDEGYFMYIGEDLTAVAEVRRALRNTTQVRLSAGLGFLFNLNPTRLFGGGSL